jgi:hypothetical protein
MVTIVVESNRTMHFGWFVFFFAGVIQIKLGSNTFFYIILYRTINQPMAFNANGVERPEIGCSTAKYTLWVSRRSASDRRAHGNINP